MNGFDLRLVDITLPTFCASDSNKFIVHEAHQFFSPLFRYSSIEATNSTSAFTCQLGCGTLGARNMLYVFCLLTSLLFGKW